MPLTMGRLIGHPRTGIYHGSLGVPPQHDGMRYCVLVRCRGLKQPVQQVLGGLLPCASVRGQVPTRWPAPQSLRRHQPLAAMEPASGDLGQQVMPDPPGTIGSVTADEAGLTCAPRTSSLRAWVLGDRVSQAWKLLRKTPSASQSYRTGQVPQCFQRDPTS